MSKAGSLFKAYCWAEALFVGYLLLKPKSAEPSEAEQALENVKTQLKEKLDGPQNP
jgi:hypothetical protein